MKKLENINDFLLEDILEMSKEEMLLSLCCI